MNLIDILFIPINKIKKLIGNTNDTGGSSTAGSVMGKLNNIINDSSLIKSNAGAVIQDSILYLPKMKWTPPPPRVFPWPNITSNSELCFYGDILYYSYYVSSSTCGIVAIDTKTNKKITEVKGYYVKQMILYNDFLYIADSLTNKVFKLNPASLAVVASTPAFGTFVNAGIMGIGNNKIYMCYTDKYVRILNATTLSSYAGSVGATYSPMSFPYEYNNILYVSQGSYVTKFDATTYKIISEKYYYIGDILESKVIYNDILYVYSQVGKKIMAIELENLTKIFESQGTYQVSDLMIYNKLLYAKGSNGIFAFYPENLDFAGQSETLPSDGYSRMAISKEGVFTTRGSDSTIHLHGHMLGVYGYKEAVL